MCTYSTHRRGFTLIEILVVMPLAWIAPRLYTSALSLVKTGWPNPNLTVGGVGEEDVP